MNSAAPKATDIVLIGGGHAHVHVLVNLALRPLPGMRVTLIARDLATPYSGMLPGVIAGLYKSEEVHIDLARLAATHTRGDAGPSLIIVGEVAAYALASARPQLAEVS